MGGGGGMVGGGRTGVPWYLIFDFFSRGVISDILGGLICDIWFLWGFNIWYLIPPPHNSSWAHKWSFVCFIKLNWIIIKHFWSRFTTLLFPLSLKFNHFWPFTAIFSLPNFHHFSQDFSPYFIALGRCGWKAYMSYIASFKLVLPFAKYKVSVYIYKETTERA